MTRDEAIAIRTQQLQGGSVDPLELQQAIETIAETNVPHTISSYTVAMHRVRQQKRRADGDAQRAAAQFEPEPEPKPIRFTQQEAWTLIDRTNPPRDPDAHIWPPE